MYPVQLEEIENKLLGLIATDRCNEVMKLVETLVNKAYQDGYDDGHDDGYGDGSVDGQAYGFSEGQQEARKRIVALINGESE